MMDTEKSDPNEHVIENKALTYLSFLMNKYLKTLEIREQAMLSNSERMYWRYHVSMDTLLSMIEAKDVGKESLKTIDALRESFLELEDNTDSVDAKIKQLNKILKTIEELVRTHRWWDMPKMASLNDFSLVDEFYGDGDG